MAMWHPDGDSLPGLPIPVFAEEGKEAVVPGPLLRMPAGTDVNLSVKNSLETDTLTVVMPRLEGGGPPRDSLVIAPGATASLRTRAAKAGNYMYRARMNDPLSRAFSVGGLMTGAIVVDEPGQTQPNDRVLVLLQRTLLNTIKEER